MAGVQELKSPIGFEEDRHQMRLRREARLDQKNLLLLTTCEI
ncbi:hypothetical protein SLEP1_g40660 [Rubroshorea leprosula]|uniref:Uncharacterized protein n=1 Tax=Rubroshorea leprosula TaxID=152421 RepID=A0AAV5L500_9ROSI|nr:hypothetical protein SLEP1_g40660 [Rubroshorea leprosula]